MDTYNYISKNHEVRIVDHWKGLIKIEFSDMVFFVQDEGKGKKELAEEFLNTYKL